MFSVLLSNHFFLAKVEKIVELSALYIKYGPAGTAPYLS